MFIYASDLFKHRFIRQKQFVFENATVTITPARFSTIYIVKISVVVNYNKRLTIEACSFTKTGQEMMSQHVPFSY